MRPAALLVLALLIVSVGCRQDMHDQPRYEAFERSDFFADHRSARPQVEGTVARGQLQEDARLFTGKEGTAFVAAFPVALTPDLLHRGQQRYQIFCTPCHGEVGLGDGMVVQRGYRAPPSFHIDRLRQEKPGYLFDVITNGFGAMPDYAAQITVPDRWAVVAYVRALQRSQHATLADVPPEHLSELEAAAPRP